MRSPAPLSLLLLATLACGGEEGGGPGAPDPHAGVVGFVDRAADAGFTFVNHTGSRTDKRYIVEAKGGGALVLDYDRDGLMDLYVVDGNTYEVHDGGARIDRTTHPDARNRLLRNRGNWKFEDVTERSGTGDRSYGFGGTAGDYDGDGWTDLYVCNWGKNKLYRNRGDGTFEDVSAKAGVEGNESYYSTGATFFDADLDGDLDLYVCNYNDIGEHIRRTGGAGLLARYKDANIPVYDGPKGIPPHPDEFYRNNGDGTFTDETATALRNQQPRYSFTPVVSDYDKDGDLDVYVTVDVMPNTMWVNDGTGCFDDRGDQSATSRNARGVEQAGMGNTVADYDQDGWIDLFHTNFDNDVNTLMRNVTGEAGVLLFEDRTEAAGLAREDFMKVCWGTKFADFNHDGWLDLFVAAGHVYDVIDRFEEVTGTTYRQLPSLWYGGGPPDWRFRFVNDEGGGPGLRIPKVGRAACVADFDNDGDMDVYLAGLNETPLLLENRLPKAGHWILLDLARPRGDRDGIGTKVTVTAGGGKIRQYAEKRLTESFIGTVDPRLHFGLGPNEKVDELTVTWLGGETQVFRDLPADRRYRLVEGGEIEEVR